MKHVARVRMLYKSILKLHRGLPKELQELGDSYAKDEFKRHKKCTPNEAVKFMTEWTKYAVDLSKQLRLGSQYNQDGSIGQTLDKNILDMMKDEQLVQLYELKLAAEGKGKADTS
uniref:Succinate dehydrogenase assembly factor 3 n=1 Tax=Xenopsylla cheopis TaxID=163159 RepID=A0A6M2DPL6_XENCH